MPGVACLKIEGRLKGPEYVAVTTAAYRQAVDAAWAALAGGGEPDLAAAKSRGGGPRERCPAQGSAPGAAVLPLFTAW